MATDFVEAHHISVVPLPKPFSVFALDGRLLAVITHHTVNLSQLISGNHCETIHFFVIPAPPTPLVLGLPWLMLHNPHIDWSQEIKSVIHH